MEGEIRRHQEVQELRWQVHELMDHGLGSWRSVEKMRAMLSCLLLEYRHGTTDEFWKYHVDRHSQQEVKSS